MTDKGWMLTRERQDIAGRWRLLPPPAVGGLSDPEGYVPSQEAVDAVNVALALGQPLLVAGAPGSGKTVLADWIAHRLGLQSAIVYQTRSTAVARDLLYFFDAVGRFHDARAETKEDGDKIDPRAYMTYTGLGEAIMRALGRSKIGAFVGDKNLAKYDEEPRRAVVLIDEIDKAPRDFPNDVLRELERFKFAIPELGGIEAEAPAQFRPIVVITSNGERSLPEAFLRRCVYFYLEFPKDGGAEIVTTRIAGMRDAPLLLADTIKVMRELRDPKYNFARWPGSAELLSFVLAIRARGYGRERRLEHDGEWIQDAMLTMAKEEVDQTRARDALKKLQFP